MTYFFFFWKTLISQPIIYLFLPLLLENCKMIFSQWLLVSVTNMFISFPFLWIWFSILKLKKHNRYVCAYHVLEWGRKFIDNCSTHVFIPISVCTSFWNLNIFESMVSIMLYFIFFNHIKLYWVPICVQNTRHQDFTDK